MKICTGEISNKKKVNLDIASDLKSHLRTRLKSFSKGYPFFKFRGISPIESYLDKSPPIRSTYASSREDLSIIYLVNLFDDELI